MFGDPALRITEGQPNQPPEQPDLPTGPTSGYVGIDYVYGTTANDPEGDDVYYQWNWGDEVSGWLGPYASNQTIEASHHWDVTGDYQISVKAKDSNDAESALSDPLTVHIVVAPQIEITSVRGGFGVSADVRNTGGVNVSGVTWVIKLQGLVVYGQEKSGTILDLAPNGTQSISTGLVLGFGRIGIVITASDVQRNATAFLFGPIVINVRQTI